MIRHDGTEQQQRYPAPFRQGYFNPAEMSLQTMLAIGIDYAGLVNYYRADNQTDGTWTRIFTGDVTMVLASIIATNLATIDADFRRDGDQPAHLRPETTVARAAHSYRMARKMDDWYVWLSAATDKSGIAVQQVIELVIRQELRPVLHDLLALLRQHPEAILDRFGIDLNAFSPVWGVEPPTADDQSKTEAQTGATPGGPEIDDLLQRWFQVFFNAASLVIRTAADLFESAYARADHEPAMALFIAFANLFRQAQQHVNGFSVNHRDYYYRDLLQIQRNDPTSDATYLLLTLDGSMPEVFVTKGTEFSAGADSQGRELIYRADRDLLVSDTSVGALHTLCFEKNVLISPETELGFATGGWLNDLPPLDITAPSDVWQQRPPSPMFGSPAGLATTETARAAQLGLSIASPVLLLGEGERRITLSIEFAATSEDLLEALIRRISQLTDTPEIGAFYNLFKQMFTFELTADSGWYTVDNWHPDPDGMPPHGTQNQLTFDMKLSYGAPPIVAYDPALHGGRYVPGTPILRMCINDQNDVYPYTLLSRLTLKEIRIDVAVDGCKDLLVYNHHGQINPSAPFQPFGPQPNVGSYLIVGSYETAQKPLTAFDVCLEWDQLPGGNQGMEAYYRQYDQPYLLELFEVSAGVLHSGHWSPVKQSERPAVKLFRRRTDDDGTTLAIAKWSVLETPNPNLHNPLVAFIPKEQFDYNLRVADGFFKFTLTRPDYAFGHKDYPFLLSRIMTANARRKKKLEMPNPPYTPVVNSIAINYRSRAVINMEKGMALHRKDTRERVNLLHPLGLERIYPPSDNRQHPMIPRFDHAGSLMIGLDGSHPTGRLSLFFHIQPKPDPLATETESSPHWCYLSSNRWCDLPKQNIVSDTTHAFKTSGIVILDIPEDIDRNNTILPNDRYWLCVSVDRAMHAAGDLYGVAAQALTATWDDQSGTSNHLTTPLPAGTITETRTAIAGIAKIAQPTPSTLGRAVEVDHLLATRVSERLRHKNRAITSWDYEHLILERFPEIFKVKCFAGTSLARGMATAAGNILVVVIPNPDPGLRDLHQRPMADAVLLERIRQFIARRSSAHASITVSNPVYEQIQARCAVKLHSGDGTVVSIKRINRAINEFLSPWSRRIGYGARFGWFISRDDLIAYLLGLDEVDYITRFSLLHIHQEGRDTYGVQDTAASSEPGPDQETIIPKDAITPWYPWSIAVPMKRHFIETTHDYRSQEPQPAGIETLTIGETFIIAGR